MLEPKTELEKFEAWAYYVSMSTLRDGDGYFADDTTDMAWQAWEAALKFRNGMEMVEGAPCPK